MIYIDMKASSLLTFPRFNKVKIGNLEVYWLSVIQWILAWLIGSSFQGTMIEFTSWIQVPYKYRCIDGSDSRYFIPIYMFWTFRNPRALNHWHGYCTPNQLSCQPPAIALLAKMTWEGIDKSPRYCYDKKRKGEYPYMQNYNQDRILDGIRPQLINIKEKDNCISFFCPFC